jgi:hypothetical protein
MGLCMALQQVGSAHVAVPQCTSLRGETYDVARIKFDVVLFSPVVLCSRAACVGHRPARPGAAQAPSCGLLSIRAVAANVSLATTQTSVQGAATRRLQGLVPFMKARTYRSDRYPQQALVEPKLVLHTASGEDRPVRGRCFRSLSCDQRALCERVPWSSPRSDATVLHARAGCMCACWWATVCEACVKTCVQRVQERVPCRQSFGMGDQIIAPVVPVVHALLHNKQNGNRRLSAGFQQRTKR